jgi:hypothetical protein
MIEQEYLNSTYTKAQADIVFGRIEHPVIADVPLMVMHLEQQRGYRRNDIRL